MLARGAASRPSRGAAALVVGAAALAAGCGGGSRQDASEQARVYRMRVVRAYFPAKQTIARRTVLELQLQNTGLRTVPNVAVTLDSLLYTEHYPELAANKRPVWVVERGPGATARPPVESQEVASPGGGQTAYVNTWALGPLPPRAIQTFRWIVVPVKAGPHVVRYAVAAGLAGKARALASVTPGVPPGRDTLQGAFIVKVAGTPPRTHVDPNTGRVVPGPYPVSP